MWLSSSHEDRRRAGRAEETRAPPSAARSERSISALLALNIGLPSASVIGASFGSSTCLAPCSRCRAGCRLGRRQHLTPCRRHADRRWLSSLTRSASSCHQVAALAAVDGVCKAGVYSMNTGMCTRVPKGMPLHVPYAGLPFPGCRVRCLDPIARAARSRHLPVAMHQSDQGLRPHPPSPASSPRCSSTPSSRAEIPPFPRMRTVIGELDTAAPAADRGRRAFSLVIFAGEESSRPWQPPGPVSPFTLDPSRHPSPRSARYSVCSIPAVAPQM